MAWTAEEQTADNIMIKVVKGNELTSIIVEDHAAQEFQTSLANGKDLNKAVMVANQLAVLGVRKDYFLLEIPLTHTAVTGQSHYGKNAVYLDLVEFTSVPPEVQYDIFGEFSPFVTPRMAVDEDMIDGIDRQEFGFILGRGFTPDDDATIGATYYSQKVRGIVDDRIQSKHTVNDATLATNTMSMVRIKPRDDGVFLIPEGGIIWVDNAAYHIAAS